MSKIAIVGVGDDGLDALSSAARTRIETADVVVGDDRVLELLPADLPAERQQLTSDLDAVVEQLQQLRAKQTVLLMFGDPMFYGLANYVTEAVGKSEFEVLPNVSSMQLAFARVKESWDEAYLTNLANHPLEKVIERVRIADKAGLFTSERVPPNVMAKELLNRHIDYFTAYVCENLGARNERVTRGSLADIAGQQFESLNVMVLVRDEVAPDRPREAAGKRLFGNPDEAFLQNKPKYGLLTPAEVRALALAELDIGSSSIVWDVGAGSGSVSVEAAQLASTGTVYAIEMDAEDQGLIEENASRFGVTNVIGILGKAPEVWEGLPDPDCVFLAGAGREVTRLSSLAFDRLRAGGRIAVNLLSIDHIAELVELLRSKGCDVSVKMVNIGRGMEQLDRLVFEPLKPMFLVSTVKVA